MKKLSVILASLVLFAGVSFAGNTKGHKQTGTTAQAKTTTTTKSTGVTPAAKGTSGTTTKRVPPTKATPKPVPAATTGTAK